MSRDRPIRFAADVGSRSAVRAAIDAGDPLPGTAGFAGELDGRLVRDVLGRVPLYVEGASIDGDDLPALDRWAFSPTDLADPVSFPAGAVGPADDPTRVWTLPDPDPKDDHALALDRLERAILSSVATLRTDGLAVAFSGGVDSALLAALLDAPLYVAGFPDSHDIAAARAAAESMGRADDLRVVELDLDTLGRAVPTVASATGRTNAMDVGIALPLYLAAEAAAADGVERLALGQGADELFGGYEKVVRLDHRVAADTTRGAVREQIATLSRQLPRDVLAIQAAGVDPQTPYLHDDVVSVALALPTELFVADGTRKRALRLLAGGYLPASVANREKKALQYGSRAARELDRLARRAGYKRRMDDHVTRYVESRLE
ncbi:asparagine synthase C-terminal domain-containing protein [Halovivax sp.]|uniref:asparagine synthase C-terminal domain-containing protein n=1 Tax=Halovivax sp. TaxID=1935978 RepID=UPI0025BDF741|nr:asparagine synthase-related protein [Halovivax sp.]